MDAIPPVIPPPPTGPASNRTSRNEPSPILNIDVLNPMHMPLQDQSEIEIVEKLQNFISIENPKFIGHFSNLVFWVSLIIR